MRKAIAFLLCMTILLLAGCAAKPEQAETPTAAPAEENIMPGQEPEEAPEKEPVPEQIPQEAVEEDAEAAAEETDDAAAEAIPENTLPENIASVFYFSSGAGAWGTELRLSPDGSFTGDFHDSDMGDTGDGYPNGTLYLCGFRGHFTVLDHPDEFSWILKMDALEQDQTAGEIRIEDGVRQIGSDPYGLDGGVDYVLYAPEQPVEGLSEELISWWPGRWNPDGIPETLGSWCIASLDAGYGFFADN